MSTPKYFRKLNRYQLFPPSCIPVLLVTLDRPRGKGQKTIQAGTSCRPSLTLQRSPQRAQLFPQPSRQSRGCVRPRRHPPGREAAAGLLCWSQRGRAPWEAARAYLQRLSPGWRYLGAEPTSPPQGSRPGAAKQTESLAASCCLVQITIELDRREEAGEENPAAKRGRGPEAGVAADTFFTAFPLVSVGGRARVRRRLLQPEDGGRDQGLSAVSQKAARHFSLLFLWMSLEL